MIKKVVFMPDDNEINRLNETGSMIVDLLNERHGGDRIEIATIVSRLYHATKSQLGIVSENVDGMK